MAARNNRGYHRHPRTTQERRFSQDRFDLTIRGKRRSNNLPNAWDDIGIRPERSWKKLRKTQYRVDKTGWCWRKFCYRDESGFYSWTKARNLVETLERFGCRYDWSYCDGYVYWFGPDLVKW